MNVTQKWRDARDAVQRTCDAREVEEYTTEITLAVMKWLEFLYPGTAPASVTRFNDGFIVDLHDHNDGLMLSAEIEEAGKVELTYWEGDKVIAGGACSHFDFWRH